LFQTHFPLSCSATSKHFSRQLFSYIFVSSTWSVKSEQKSILRCRETRKWHTEFCIHLFISSGLSHNCRLILWHINKSPEQRPHYSNALSSRIQPSHRQSTALETRRVSCFLRKRPSNTNWSQALHFRPDPWECGPCGSHSAACSFCSTSFRCF